VDGVGEWTTTSMGTGKENKIKLTKDLRWPHSVGMLYSAFTYFLGFRVNEGEYKLMGLSAYGKPKYYDLIMEKLIDLKDDGSFHLNMKYFAFAYDKVMTNKKFSTLFNCSVRTEDGPAEQIHYDIAASAQKVLEEILMRVVRYIHKNTGQKNLCLGGGVALNGVANYKILKEGPFENIFIPPSPGDAGSALGAALYGYYSIQNKQRSIEKDNSIKVSNEVFIGPEYSNEDIENFLNEKGISFEKYERQQLLEKVAKLISEQNVVGWYQGRMEWGPRALGNRSILSDPRNPKMKDILNEKIKHREGFRPFAPSILEEYASEYFELEISSPYMLLVTKVKKPDQIPAVTHVDGTARVQTISRITNELYYDLINEFYKLTNVPVLINTSMNVRGEPIVNTPEQAHNMIVKTDMDYIVMGNYLIPRL
jgi:carbamoyltransferase